MLENDVRATMSDASSYVQSREVSIEGHVSELERLKQQLLMTSPSDRPKMMGEFDYNVHMMVIKVSECLRQWDATHNRLLRLSNQPTESNRMNGTALCIGLSMVTPIVVLWLIDKYYGMLGLGSTVVGLLWYVNSRRSAQETRAQVQLDIRTKCSEIGQHKSQLQNYISQVNLKVQQLHKDNIRVRNVPNV